MFSGPQRRVTSSLLVPAGRNGSEYGNVNAVIPTERMKRVLEYDPITGITTTFEHNDLTNETTIGRHQDVGLILDINKAITNDEDISKAGIKNSWWHYAQVPNIIIEKWKREHGVDFFNKDHEKGWLKLINQPEYRYLKTTTKMHRG